jgi:polysaccharide biosynthesis/export protein
MNNHLIGKITFVMALGVIVVLSSCVSTKDMVYLQGSDSLSVKSEKILQTYEVKIQEDDMLSITLNTKDKELLEPFANSLVLGTSSTAYSSSNQDELSHIRVGHNGNIELPVLGIFHAEGLSCNKLSTVIEDRIKDKKLLMDPDVTVRLKNFKVSVLGAVSKPGAYTIDSERITVLDALSLAGDLTAGGQRSNVLLLREENGKRVTQTLDLTRIGLVDSPYYYLHQNDVIYVEPNSSILVTGSPGYTYLTASSSIMAASLSLVSLIALLIK